MEIKEHHILAVGGALLVLAAALGGGAIVRMDMARNDCHIDCTAKGMRGMVKSDHSCVCVAPASECSDD